jgi:hypothetical protein
MGTGIKMRNAHDKAGTALSVDILQRDHDAGIPIPELFCADQACRKPVRFVPRHQQNRKNLVEPVNVPAYIGLTSGSEHIAGCRFDAVKRITAIADESDPDFLAPLNAGQYELRLLLLHNGLSNQPISGVSPGLPQPATGATSVTKDYVPSGEKLDAYLRTTADLLELRELCDSDALLAARLTLRFGGKRIPWHEFFYEKEDYETAWRAVKRAAGKLHPIALLGEVKSVVPPKAGATYTTTYLNCHSAYRATAIPNEVEAFEVTVQFNDPGWLAGFAPGSHVLMFGLWEHKAAVRNVSKSIVPGVASVTYITHKLLLRPKFKQQLRAAF